MYKRLLFIFTTVSIFGQDFNISVYGITVAKATWKLYDDKVDLEYKTKGLANLIWPAENMYSTEFNPKNYKLNSFTKKINQGELKQLVSLNMNGDSLIYKSKHKIRTKPTYNLFSLLVLIQKNFVPELDTQWLLFEHEGALFNGRFISAGLDTINYNGDNIVCDYFRLDVKKDGEESSFLDVTDRLMSFSINENTTRQIWVERNGNRRIIKANILANGFPFQVDIKND
tara:strand:+ start:245 stop:928 length:684 start_codon:yes stop_codon:yes gene_type:complete